MIIEADFDYTIESLLELVCLKNRYAAPGYSCWFKYYAKYDLFVVDEEGENAEDLKKRLMI